MFSFLESLLGGFGALVLAVVLLVLAIRILKEYERGVHFRLGRLIGVKGPGLVFIIPFVDRLVYISLRTVVLDVPVQEVITLDNVTCKVNAVVYYRVVEPSNAVVNVERYHDATAQISQTTLRSVVGQAELDELLSQRDKLNQKLQQIIDEATDAWGVKVSAVEIKDVVLPTDMQRAIARQAQAERDRRAIVIQAEGEKQASRHLAQASQILAAHPGGLTLRALRTLSEVSLEKNNTILFPFPMELTRFFMGGADLTQEPPPDDDEEDIASPSGRPEEEEPLFPADEPGREDQKEERDW